MKYNDKLFYQSTTDAFETQEIGEDTKIELHYMNDEPFFMELVNKSNFSAWSTVDGKNYKLFIEKGIYEETSGFYTKDVNEIWIEFWNKIDKMRKRYLFFVMLPMLALLFIAIILLSIFIPNNIVGYLIVFGVALVGSLFASSFLSRKMQLENIKGASRVRDHIGLEEFKVLVDKQEKYIEKFYEDLQKKYEEEDRLAEEAEKLAGIEEVEEVCDEQEENDNEDAEKEE